MKIFAISDLHLSVNNDKPMDIFGPVWEGYLDKIFSQWQEKVGQDDLVLMAGDLSWAMKLEEVKADLALFDGLPGKKVIIRGNHDYWWKSISSLRAILPTNFYAIQNDAIRFDGVVLCGTQRDLLRMKNREAQGKVSDLIVEQLFGFTDLVQFIMLSETLSGDKKIVAEDFVKFLTKEKAQNIILKSGLFSVIKFDKNSEEMGIMQNIIPQNFSDYVAPKVFIAENEIKALQKF